MRFIPTRVHGVLDYMTAGVLIAAPSLLNFRKDGMQRWLPIALGVGTIGYSLLTDYELGLFKVIPMPMHLALDAANGALRRLAVALQVRRGGVRAAPRSGTV